MPVITKIVEQKRRQNRRNIYLDGRFAFGCNINVVARFRLSVGLQLSGEQIREIESGEVRQECFDKAMEFLQQRLHSRAELFRKLKRHEWGDQIIDGVLGDLERLGYLNDERYAQTKAMSAAQHRHHGRRRAFIELIRSGVQGDVANRALNTVYNRDDSLTIARDLAKKQRDRLAKLDPQVARRRLVGMLQRRGFDYDTIKPVVDEVLGDERSD